jgi:hypothetical protein
MRFPSRSIARPIQVAPVAVDLEVGFVDVLRPVPRRRLRNASPIMGRNFASHCQTHSWLAVKPRSSMISLKSRSVSR